MSGPDSGFSGGGGSSRHFQGSPSADQIQDSVGGGSSSRNFSWPSTFSVGGSAIHFYVDYGCRSINFHQLRQLRDIFFTITGNLNVTTSIHCRKKTFTKSLGGHGPPAPPLATPLAELSGKQQHTPNGSDLLRLYSQTDFKIVRRIKVILCKTSTVDV